MRGWRRRHKYYLLRLMCKDFRSTKYHTKLKGILHLPLNTLTHKERRKAKSKWPNENSSRGK